MNSFSLRNDWQPRRRQTSSAASPGRAGVWDVSTKSACACGGGCPRCRPGSRLKLGKPEDSREREAETISGSGRGAIQAPSWAEPTGMPPAPASVEAALVSPGRPLADGLRQTMEARLGRDFSRVRIHAEEAAARSAGHIHAHAYGVGNDLVFAPGRFAPETTTGARLLTHELVHVAQGGSENVVRRSMDQTGAVEPASLDHQCDLTDDENFPTLMRGDWRNAVGVAQVDLNRILPQIAACLIDPGCMAGYTPKAQNFMAEQMGMLSQMPIEEDCRFGLDTLHATYAAQAYFFKKETAWDGVIGPDTWRAIDELARSPLAPPSPTPSPLLWDYIQPPQPPRPPVYL